ncbi:reverse transcriptase family protein [Celeribacter halophilus]|uniref:RNA-directed DNA polymerase n=1 Tax=Celeribacter halophilus TaxID=576117 RepID=A0A1I3RTP9_9RHOB|nr:reverse transcriptase family protein [Celeribacter halophilus]PZX12724.1 reverse transcriptase (RNA-dependent DNA polymerase) [Celeribacter halophilus]SFJ48687.1 Reverse transcriptase (RNA-dependent DNA polymerase) [Celeribacter halophilus]
MAFDYDLRRIKTKGQLLTYIGLEEYFFDKALDFSVTEYEARMAEYSNKTDIGSLFLPLFWKHEIPKRNPKRGNRVVWEADSHINNALKGLARRLTLFFGTVIPDFPHPQNCGYVRGRNIRENAQFHIGAKFLVKADIEDYFPSISFERVSKFLENLGVNAGIARQISNFLCIDGKLPLGLPTSPIIANAISHLMDFNLNSLAQTHGSVYSRYADDLTFSSDDTLPSEDDISKVVEHHGFALAADKTRHSKRGQNHYVTGLSVSESDAPHVPRRMKRSLRQELHFSKKYGLNDHLGHLGLRGQPERQSYINHVDGRVKYIAFHEPGLAATIVPLWQSILEESGEGPSFKPKNQNRVPFQFYVDETEFTLDGVKYLALGMSASQHQDHLNDTTQNLWEDYLANPWSDGALDQIYAKGMHFTDTTEDLRRTYLSALQPLPFNGYIVFGKLTSDYQETYLTLLKFILRRRLMAAESRAAHFYFEQTSKVSKDSLTRTVNAVWQELRNENNRRPEYVVTEIVDKKYFGIAVPDFMLAVFRRYLTTTPSEKDYRRKANMFEMMRDKIRLIVNADTGEEFGRRNQLANPNIEDL